MLNIELPRIVVWRSDSTFNLQPSTLNVLRNGVVSASSPGIASQDAPHCEGEPFQWAMLDYRLSGIFRARWCESA